MSGAVVDLTAIIPCHNEEENVQPAYAEIKRERFRTMHLTKGRENDNVVLPGGKRLWSQTFLGIAERHPGVTECFVRQERDGSIRVHVVPADRSAAGTAAVLDSVRGHLFEVAGGPFPLEVVAADRVPLTVGGKGRFVESEYAGP